MKKKLIELKQRRAAALEAATAIVETAEAEDRGLTEEESDSYDSRMAEAAELRERIERLEAQDQNSRDLNAPQGPVLDSDDAADIGMDERDVRNYSIVRAIRALSDTAGPRWENAPLEKEASDAIAERLGRSPRGFFVPNEVQRRDMTVGTATAGGNLVSTDLLSESFIDMMRNRMVVQQAGATVLAGLVGNVAIPRQTGGATAYWVAESGSPTESAQTIDQLTMTPKTVGAFTDLSRKLLLQSSIDVENFCRRDLSTVLALAIDLAALHGSGSSNQPTGVASTSGIGSVAGGTNGAAPTWAHVVNLEREVAIDNADTGSLSYITNAKVRGKMKQTAKVSSTDSIMLWENNSSPLNGYPAYVTNQVSSTLDKGSSTGVCSAIFFGNWADLIVGLWGVLDILVDPYTGGTAGTVRVVALQDVDIAVRHAESFAAMLDATTT